MKDEQKDKRIPDGRFWGVKVHQVPRSSQMKQKENNNS